MYTLLRYKKTKKVFKIPTQFNDIRKYCKKNNAYIKIISDKKVQMNEYVLRNVLGIPWKFCSLVHVLTIILILKKCQNVLEKL